jgi:hypothetical protein
MASWEQIANEAPEFAQRVRRAFDVGKHKTMATVRGDGSPRISGIELDFGDEQILFGSMPGALKGRDLRRDPRLALHSPSVDPPPDDPGAWPGEAKIAGRAVLVAPPDPSDSGAGDHVRVDVAEVVLTYVGTPADHLVIESWHEGRGWQRRTRG